MLDLPNLSRHPFEGFRFVSTNAAVWYENPGQMVAIPSRVSGLFLLNIGIIFKRLKICRHPFEGFRFVSTSKNKQKNYFQISRHPFEGFRFVSTNGGGMFDTTTKESPSLRGFQVCFYSKPPRH